MKLIGIKGERVLDSRGQETIAVFVKTARGIFTCSSPSGKSKGKYETPSFNKDVQGSIEMLHGFAEKIKSVSFERFEDLDKIEKITGKKIGANTLYALEASVLKALAAEEKKELWELLGKGKKMPVPVGNTIGGGLHTQPVSGLRADFQEFEVIPRLRKFADNVFVMKKFHEITGKRLELMRVRGKLNDENAFSTSLDNETCLDVMQASREELMNELDERIDIGLDVASSSFFTGIVYDYKNNRRVRKRAEQVNYLKLLAEKYNLFYLEDPLDEEDFSSFAELRELLNHEKPTLIVGDDLVVSSVERLKRAIKIKSVNSIIVKPNQNGSLLEIKKLIELAKKNNIATVMSHRSGETMDNTIADLAFSWQTDFIKTGIIGKERDAKLKRLVEIESKI